MKTKITAIDLLHSAMDALETEGGNDDLVKEIKSFINNNKSHQYNMIVNRNVLPVVTGARLPIYFYKRTAKEDIKGYAGSSEYSLVRAEIIWQDKSLIE